MGEIGHVDLSTYVHLGVFGCESQFQNLFGWLEQLTFWYNLFMALRNGSNVTLGLCNPHLLKNLKAVSSVIPLFLKYIWDIACGFKM